MNTESGNALLHAGGSTDLPGRKEKGESPRSDFSDVRNKSPDQRTCSHPGKTSGSTGGRRGYPIRWRNLFLSTTVRCVV